MAQPLGTLTVVVNDTEYELPVKKIDFVRAEQQFQRSVAQMDSLTAVYELAWLILRRTNVDNIPATFDEFLDLEPDVDATFADGEDAGGKASGQDQPTG
jgi:hypothetical protein